MYHPPRGDRTKDGDEAAVRELLEKEPLLSSKAVSELLNIPDRSIRNTDAWKQRAALRKESWRPGSADASVAPRHEKRFSGKKIDPWAWLRWCAEGERLHEDTIDERRILQWKSPLRKDRPVAVCFLGDAHAFSAHTDHARLERDLQTIRDREDLFLCALGDQCQHMLASFPSALPVANQMAGPDVQVKVWWAILMQMQRKVVSVSVGNHEAFAEKVAACNPFGDAARAIVPVFNGKGLTFLKVGNETYSILTLHKGRGSSRYSRAAQGLNAYSEDYPADVSVGAHTHHFGMGWDDHYALAREVGGGFGGPRLVINTGTYQTRRNAFGNRLGGSGGAYAAPTVVFLPHKHRAVPFRYIEDALVWLRGWEIEHGRKLL
jgi:hypothetical protein